MADRDIGAGKMLEWFAASFWFALLVYFFWFLFEAKTNHPISLDDLALTWRIHKQQTGCKAKRSPNLIKLNDKAVGFRCECGYEYVQKRLITQKAPSYSTGLGCIYQDASVKVYETTKR